MPIRNQSDIAAIEAIPLSERALPESSYAALVEASKRSCGCVGLLRVANGACAAGFASAIWSKSGPWVCPLATKSRKCA